MLKRLGQLPYKLEELYRIIFDGIMARRESDRVIVRRTMYWLLYSQSPTLSADGLLEAVVTHTNGCEPKMHKDALLGLCRNLVELDEPSGTFRFPHLSVREFFVEHDDFKAPKGHCLLAETCWTVLNVRLTDNSPLEHHLEGTLVRYAVENFLDHCQLASNLGESNQSIRHLLDSFFSTGDSQVFHRWTKALLLLKEQGILEQVLHPFSNDHTPLTDAISFPPNPSFAISIWGFTESLGVLSKLDNEYVIQANAGGKSLLCVACEYNRGEITKDIISRMKAIGHSIQTPSPHGHTALHSASQYGSDDPIYLLLDEGVDVNVYTNERFSNTDPWPPIINISGVNGATSFTIQDRVTPLHLASRNGHLHVVKRLLAKSALVNATSMIDPSSFHFGSISSEEGAVHFQYEGGLSALHCAAEKGNEEIVKLLLLAGASVQVPSKLDLPTLKIDTILVNSGSMNIKVNGGMNPVLWALEKSRSDGLMAAELICLHQEISEVDSRSENSWIPLEIGTVLANNGSIHIKSNAKVAIRSVLANSSAVHLSFLQPTIGMIMNNSASIYIKCEGGKFLGICNNSGSMHIKYRHATTFKDISDRERFHALLQYIEKLESSRQSIVPHVQLGLITNNDGNLNFGFPIDR